MAALITDELWVVIARLIPKRPPRPKGGRPPIDDRLALTGIVFVLKSSIPWNHLPQEMGCGSGVSCWRRLQEWTQAGLWPAIHAKLLCILGKAGQIDASRALIDSASVRAVFGGSTPGRTRPTAGKTARNGTC
jgi:transposase